MKKVKMICMLFICMLFTNFFTFGGTLPGRVEQYDIAVKYDGGTHLQVQAKITCNRNPSESGISFLFSSDAKITGIKSGKSETITFQHSSDTLQINLPDKFARLKKLNFTIDYSLEIDSLHKGITRVSSWYPSVPNNPARYKVTSYCPDGFEIILPGTVERRVEDLGKTMCRWSLSSAVSKISMVIAKAGVYKKAQIMSKNTRLNFYMYSDDEELLGRFKKESLNAFNFFNSYIGDYRYNELTFIEIPDMMYIDSQPGFIMIGEVMLNVLYKKNLYDWPPHEIAHQWFGSGIFSVQKDIKTWCIFEPLAEYLRLTFSEDTGTKGSLEKGIRDNMKEYETEYSGTDKDLPLIESASSRVTYIKGPYVLNRLNRLCGESLWHNFLRNLYSEYRGRVLTFEDFHRSLDKSSHTAAELYMNLVQTKGMPAQ